MYYLNLHLSLTWSLEMVGVRLCARRIYSLCTMCTHHKVQVASMRIILKWPVTLTRCPWRKRGQGVLISSTLLMSRSEHGPCCACMWQDSQSSPGTTQQLACWHPVTCFHCCLHVCVSVEHTHKHSRQRKRMFMSRPILSVVCCCSPCDSPSP